MCSMMTLTHNTPLVSLTGNRGIIKKKQNVGFRPGCLSKVALFTLHFVVISAKRGGIYCDHEHCNSVIFIVLSHLFFIYVCVCVRERERQLVSIFSLGL